MINRITALFPVWGVLYFLLAWYKPEPFLGLGSWILPGLGMIMLFMGLTISWQDLGSVRSRWYAVLMGLILQFLVMPLSGLVIARMFHLSDDLAIGMILVGSVAGGTASNVMTYLAKGDVALSICMTTVSTVVGCFATPFLISTVAGRYIEVDPVILMWGLTKIVLMPVVTGVVISYFFSAYLKRLMIVLPLLSMMTIIFVIGVVVAQNSAVMISLGTDIIMAIMLHNAAGFAFGYGLSALFGFDQTVRKTIAIEVGFQNSGLAVVLAAQFFTPAAALPGTFFTIWQNVAGSFLATLWTRTARSSSSTGSDVRSTESL